MDNTDYFVVDMLCRFCASINGFDRQTQTDRQADGMGEFAAILKANCMELRCLLITLSGI